MIRAKKAGTLIIGLRLFFIFSVAIYFIVIIALTTYNYSYMRGYDLIKEGNYIEGIKSLQTTLTTRDKLGSADNLFDKKILGLFPLFMRDEIDVRFYLADAYKSLKDYPSAINEYQRILSFDNNNFYAISYLAETFYLTMDFENAIKYYNKLVVTEPTSKGCNYYYQMGKAYMALLDCQRAIEYFNKALEYGENETIKRFLDECYKENGKGI